MDVRIDESLSAGSAVAGRVWRGAAALWGEKSLAAIDQGGEAHRFLTQFLYSFSRAVHGIPSDRADDGSLAATLRPDGGGDGAQLGGTAIG